MVQSTVSGADPAPNSQLGLPLGFEFRQYATIHYLEGQKNY